LRDAATALPCKRAIAGTYRRSREWRRLRCHDQRDADWSRPLGS